MALDLTAFRSALASLRKAVTRSQAEPADDEVRDSVIQRFEYTYELAWKTRRRYLAQEGISEVTAFSQRDLYREAAARGFIEDPSSGSAIKRPETRPHTPITPTRPERFTLVPSFFVTTPPSSWPSSRADAMIDLEPRYLDLVRDLLAKHLGEAQVFAFGSRVRGEARRYSDLDLVIRTKGPLDLDRLGELRAAFSESDLPIKVDVLDWAGMDDGIRAQITANLVSLYP